jgi:hypothetical protein
VFQTSVPIKFLCFSILCFIPSFFFYSSVFFHSWFFRSFVSNRPTWINESWVKWSCIDAKVYYLCANSMTMVVEFRIPVSVFSRLPCGGLLQFPAPTVQNSLVWLYQDHSEPNVRQFTLTIFSVIIDQVAEPWQIPHMENRPCRDLKRPKASPMPVVVVVVCVCVYSSLVTVSAWIHTGTGQTADVYGSREQPVHARASVRKRASWALAPGKASAAHGLYRR